MHDGAWGFASGVARTADAAVALAEQAVATAKVSRVLSARAGRARRRSRSTPTPSGSRPTRSTRSTCPEAERIGRLTELSERLLAADGVDHVDAALMQVLENKFYADTAGTVDHPAAGAHPPGVHRRERRPRRRRRSRSMRTLAPPAGRGWEYLTGTGWDFDAEIAELPEPAAPSTSRRRASRPGSYDLVIDPSNLWLTIHESIGHATELDRALGYEAAYAGTSFATLDQLGSLRYGSAGHERHRRPHASSTAWPPSATTTRASPTQQFDIVRDGILVGYQLNRQMAAHANRLNGGRSNGCAFADSAGHIPLQRMANVSLQPAAGRPVASRS